MLAETPIEEFAAVLDRCATDALWEAAIDHPPVDAFVLARRLGIHVAVDASMKGRARFVRPQDDRRHRSAILLAPDPRPERRQWAVAHEVGECLAKRVFEMMGILPNEAPSLTRERVANALAGRLLVPRRWLESSYRDLEGDLQSLKAIFSTASYELIARRVLEGTTAPLAVTVYDKNAQSWRRWNQGGAPPRLSMEESDCQQFAHLRSEAAYSSGEADSPLGRIRCWPIHEARWKREILLSEFEQSPWEEY